MSPRLSVIIPTHRRVDALAACLESLAAQTAPRDAFEVLIVDDASPPEEHARLKALVEGRFKDLDVTLWRQEKSGPARARNQAVQRAKAPLVIFLNDDVTLDPNNFEAHLAAHAAHPEEEAVFRGVTEWAPDLPRTPVMRWMRENTFVYDRVQYHPVEQNYILFHTCDLSMKTSLLRAFPFDESFDVPCCEDTDLALRLLKSGRLRLRLLPEARSLHHHPYTLRSFLRWIMPQGRGLAMLLDRHPELEYRLRGIFRLKSTQRRRLARMVGALARGRTQAALSSLFDLLTLRQIDRHRPRPHALGPGGPYPEVLLETLNGADQVSRPSTS
jgi:GT2 family glycosyltransferase